MLPVPRACADLATGAEIKLENPFWEARAARLEAAWARRWALVDPANSAGALKGVAPLGVARARRCLRMSEMGVCGGGGPTHNGDCPSVRIPW